jgi:hypothetical protein
MWQEQQEANQAQYIAECEQAEADQDMEPHKRSGYFEMMCEIADLQRKWIRENGK